MKKRITRITAALAAAALLAGCGSISSNDGGYYATEAAAQKKAQRQDYYVVDVETTGLRADQNDIIELAARTAGKADKAAALAAYVHRLGGGDGGVPDDGVHAEPARPERGYG